MGRKNEYINKINKQIAKRIESLRLARGFSRNELGEVIGVSSQQIKKYEEATNGVSIARLLLIAQALGKNVSYFYEGIDVNKKEPKLTQHQHICLEVSENFTKIRNFKQKEAVNQLIKSLIKQNRSPE